MSDDAGRELDARVAERVMGETDLAFRMSLIPHYSTDMTAAWEIVEVLRARGLRVDLHCEEPTYNCVEIIKPFPPEVSRTLPPWADAADEWSAVAETMPLAICRAALAAAENAAF